MKIAKEREIYRKEDIKIKEEKRKRKISKDRNKNKMSK